MITWEDEDWRKNRYEFCHNLRWELGITFHLAEECINQNNYQINAMHCLEKFVSVTRFHTNKFMND